MHLLNFFCTLQSQPASYGVIEVKGVKPCVFRGHKPNDQSAYANRSFELCQMVIWHNGRFFTLLTFNVRVNIFGLNFAWRPFAKRNGKIFGVAENIVYLCMVNALTRQL